MYTYMYVSINIYRLVLSLTFAPGDEELGSDENSSEVPWTWDGLSLENGNCRKCLDVIGLFGICLI